MQVIKFIVFLNVFIVSTAAESYANSTQKLLSRRKRYIAFPDGSSVSVCNCFENTKEVKGKELN